MAKKYNNKNEEILLRISKDEAEHQLKNRLDLGYELLNSQINSESQIKDLRQRKKKWVDYTAELLKKIFNNSENAKEFEYASGSIRVVPDELWGGSGRVQVMRNNFINDLQAKLTVLESIIERLELFSIKKEVDNYGELGDEKIDNKSVFIVHGHDEESKQTVARIIEKLGLEAIILHEKPNKGRTLINKFQDYSNVGFAIILLTPDDLGTSKKEENLKSRARQNVIFELGFFLGKLGIERVCAIKKGDLDLPSDYQGVLYIEMDQNNAWRFSLATELKAVGYNIDLNKLI